MTFVITIVAQSSSVAVSVYLCRSSFHTSQSDLVCTANGHEDNANPNDVKNILAKRYNILSQYDVIEKTL